MNASESAPLLTSPPEKPGVIHGTSRWRWALAIFALAVVGSSLGVVLSTLKRHRHLSTTRASSADETLQVLLTRLERGQARAPYCQAPVSSRATYRRPSALANEDVAIERILVISRHGDRSPQNVLKDDANVTWECSAASYMFLGDANAKALDSAKSSPAVVAKRVARIPAHDSWRPHMWQGSCAPSELTAKGQRMMLDFGRHLRDIYVDGLRLLPKHHDAKALRVRATDVTRTLMSAQALVEGIYPQASIADNQVEAAHKSRSATVPIHVLPVEVDPIHSNKLDVSCPALQRAQAQLREDPVWNAFLAYSLPTRALVETVAPMRAPRSGGSSDAMLINAALAAGQALPWSIVEAQGKKGVPSVTENLACRECWNMTLPCAPTSRVMRGVAEYARAEGFAAAQAPLPSNLLVGDDQQLCLDHETVRRAHLFKSFDFYYRNNGFANQVDLIVPLELGPLLREWHEALTSPLHASHRAHLYLAHDGTLSGLLGALRAAPEHHVWPAYRSNLVFEVWRVKRTGEQRIRVLHDGEPLVTEGPGALPLGDGSLALDRFVSELLLARSVRDWDAACQADF